MPRYQKELGRSSPLKAVLPGFRSRDGQLRLAEQVGGTIERGGVLVAEAATGIGKSLAYLVPAAMSGQRVVISTATKALQGQLLTEDLPLARTATGMQISAAVVKGRSNYVCRVQRAFAHQRVPEEYSGQLGRLEDWLVRTREGDRDELPFVPSATAATPSSPANAQRGARSCSSTTRSTSPTSRCVRPVAASR